MCYEQIEKCVYGTISRNWELLPIGEYSTTITDFVANGSFAALKENVVYKDSPDVAVLIRLVDFNNGFVGPFVFIDESSYAFLRKSKLFGGEIIISNVGANVGTVFKAPLLPYKMSLAPNSIMLKTKGFNDFYYYWFSSSYGQFALKSIVTGSAQPMFNKTDFRKILVPVPPLPEQRAIAATLSCLDDKIELNNRMNKTLEEMAQAVFKSWFVDFEPFQGGEFVDSELGRIPKGWRVGTLTEIADFLNGLAMQKYRPTEGEMGLPVLKIKELGQARTDSNSDICTSKLDAKYIVHDGDIIFSWSGTLLVDIWCGGTCGLNQHLFKVTSKTHPKWYIYFWTKSHLVRFQAIARDKATTMGHIKRGELDNSKVLIPDDKSMKKLNGTMMPLIDMLITNKVQSQLLEKTRDDLLPRLMNGEIRVPTNP